MPVDAAPNDPAISPEGSEVQLAARDAVAEISAIREQLQRYSVKSIVRVSLDQLWTDYGNKLDNLRAAPWITLQLCKWALQNDHSFLNIGPAITVAVFDELRQAVWDVPTWDMRPGAPVNFRAAIRPMLQQQVEYQRRDGYGFLRWAALMAQRPSTDSLYRRFVTSLGMEPEMYIDLAFAVFAAVLDHGRRTRSDFFAPMGPEYSASMSKMLALLSRDLPALRRELRKPEASAIRGRAELNQFTYLRRFPFVRLTSAALDCWHPRVLGNGLEDAVHIRLSDYGEQYTQPFSRIFEEYVLRLARWGAPAVIAEHEVHDLYGSGTPMVEAVIQCTDCNVLVEAKMALFADSVLVTDNPTQIYQKTKRVYEAIQQGRKVSALLADKSNAWFRPQVVEDFLLVVTSRQLHLGYGKLAADIYPRDRLGDHDEDPSHRLPLRNIFILSIEDFEHLASVLSSGKADLVRILRDAAAANQSPETAKLYFIDHLRRYGNVPWSPLLRGAIDASVSRLERIGGDFSRRETS